MHDTPKKPKGAGKSSFELIDSKQLAALLPVKPGTVVLDLACGKGNYSLFLSEIVGKQGLVYAVDLWKEGLLLLEEQVEAQDISNILTLLADASQDIDIDSDSVDVCLMATVLHDFEEAKQAGNVLRKIKTILKPGGHLAVIEFKKIEGPPGPPISIRLSEDDVDELVSGYGFKKLKATDMGDYTYLMTFRAP